MFLHYLGEGPRKYGLKPVATHTRQRWAFQCIVRGGCTFEVRDPEAGLRSLRLPAPWLAVTAPGCAHGWKGTARDQCEVRVFQFDEADPLLANVLGQGGWRCLSLTPGELRSVQQLHGRCAGAKERMDRFAPLEFRITATELALLAVRKLPPAELGPPPDMSRAKVAEALAWYGAHLGSAPRIADVAAAIHLSPAHLRRLFHQVLGTSPQVAFTRLQFERAEELLRNPALTLEAVAEGSGFGSGSAFSRAFRKAFRMPPRVYRARLGS